MPLNLLGKVLFPRLQPWQRRRRIRVIFGVLLAALFLGGTVGVMIYKQGMTRH